MTGSNHFLVKSKEEDGPVENVELSLGLSLNGRFGMEPQRSVAKENDNKLVRASSVTDFVNFPVDVELSLYSPLTRTCSLPPETEVEWRKRKELQSLRRSEAKRRRVEKLKKENEMFRVGLKQSPSSPLPSLSSPPAPPLRFPSQGSIGSQESGGSSGVSDLDSQPFPGTNKETNETTERFEVKCNPKITFKPDKHRAFDETMPCVSTKGDGPDGRRIQGFLYRYGKGEEVRIVCVCHGSFLTPAEFVKHGGGGDVDHPLRHIIVTSLFR
ncbi:hypothetical protein L1987_44024 [Smallanthus sonchifolius]|uniref:Uncharacterized protein n=1 Tax=Smallanthus sonchifolius TaxID=185202 RepID=A0ACB9GPH8_9ASTR|nr:hypothetical protein L1987_44024 [Smallanthus sonchifolius]